MPTPSEPQPVPLQGGTNAGVGPLRVCALADAPASSRMIDGLELIFADRDHQRRLSELGLARVDRRTAFEQRAQRGRSACPRGCHQRGLSAWIDGIGIDAGVEQTPNHVGVAVEAGEIEWRHAVAIRGGSLCAGAQQHVSDVQAVGIDRRVQGRRPVHACRVDIGLLSDERANGGVVAPRCRIDERVGLSRPRRKLAAGQQRGPQPQETAETSAQF